MGYVEGVNEFIEIPLTQGRKTIIDVEDYPKVQGYCWRFHCGYARANVYDPSIKKSRAVHMSHLILPPPLPQGRRLTI